MPYKILTRLIAAFAALCTVLPVTAYAIPYDEYMSGRYEYTNVTYNLAPGLKYTETLTENAKYGVERSYIYEYTPMQGTAIVPSYGSYVYGTESLGTITKELEQDGKRVVGGINGDFYIMSTGVPLGAMIVDGEIVTSDSGYTAMGFDAYGNAFISKPNLVTSITGENVSVNVGHINKTPYEYSLYLLTDKFDQTTRSAKPASEYILVPYSAEEVFASAEQVLPEEEGKKYVYVYADVPSDTTDQPAYYAKRYTVCDAKLTVGCSINVVVSEIKENSTNSEIPAGCFVLTAENNNQLYLTAAIKKGAELTVSVSGEAGWDQAVNAIGVYGGYILRDGEYCDDVEIDHYPYANPRTAAGITADGKVIFYCVDGRQDSSGGLRIDQLSHELKNLGCVTAINLDGGGSTTAYAALPGDKTSTLKNSPSGIFERKTANSILFVNTLSSSGVPAHYNIIPEKPYVMAGGSKYTLGKPVATDYVMYPVELPEDLKYEYYTDPQQTDSVIVDGNTFVSGNICGNVNIYVRIYEGDTYTQHPAGSICVLFEPQYFSVGEAEYEISPFESLQLSLNASYHTAQIYYDKDSLRWSIPGTVIGREQLYADGFYDIAQGETLESEKLSINSDLVITPKTHGETLEVKAKFGSLEAPVSVKVKEFPYNDSFGHWSAPYLYEIFEYGLMQGEPDGDKTAFRPERTLTKTEFLIILARVLDPYVDMDAAEGFEIVETQPPVVDPYAPVVAENTVETVPNMPETEMPDDTATEYIPGLFPVEYPESVLSDYADAAEIPEWAIKYYESLSFSGLLDVIAVADETGAKYLHPNQPITRLEVLRTLGALCDEAQADFVTVFADGAELLTDEYYGYINNALALELFAGYEDGTLRPQNNLTRAEAATVILRYYTNPKLK